MVKNIVFTGGGSGGHVVPALTLIRKLKQLHPEIKLLYIGSYTGIEREIIESEGIPYQAISTGKLRRYFSWQNFIDIFKVAFGIAQAFMKLAVFSPRKTLIFSTGGFVTVPVVLAARLSGKKVYIHEQTSRIGLANKIASRFAHRVFITFRESAQFFPSQKTVHSGYPLRDECFEKETHIKKWEDIDLENKKKPLLFVTGGGNGALLLNEVVKRELKELEKDYLIIHQVGKKFIEEYSSLRSPSYHPVAFVDEMIDLFKFADVVISRAGAGTVCELMALKKKSIFVPLKIAQKNEQFHNAKEAENVLGSWVIEEEEFQSSSLKELVKKFREESKRASEESYFQGNPTDFLLTEMMRPENE